MLRLRHRDDLLHYAEYVVSEAFVRGAPRLHFGTMGLAPSEQDFVSSIPPSYTGGNINDRRIGQGARMYYPVAVPGAFFSVGDPHAVSGSISGIDWATGP